MRVTATSSASFVPEQPSLGDQNQNGMNFIDWMPGRLQQDLTLSSPPEPGSPAARGLAQFMLAPAKPLVFFFGPSCMCVFTLEQ